MNNAELDYTMSNADLMDLNMTIDHIICDEPAYEYLRAREPWMSDNEHILLAMWTLYTEWEENTPDQTFEWVLAAPWEFVPMWHEARLHKIEQAAADKAEYDATFDEETGEPWVQRWTESPVNDDEDIIYITEEVEDDIICITEESDDDVFQ